MKALVAVALIVCGTGLIGLPYVYHATIMGRVMDTMVAMGKTVNLTGDLPKYSDAVCMLVGAVMVLAGTVMGWRSESAQTVGAEGDEG